jgi:hypothetical protein
MTLQSSMRSDGIASHRAPFGGWTTTWSDGPPSDWDEIRDRLRSLHSAGSERRRQPARAGVPEVIVSASQPSLAVGLTLDTSDHPQRARLSWRRADAPSPSPLRALLAPLRGLLASLPAARWWQEHDPLLVQRLLLLVSVLLLVLLVLQIN